MKRLFLFILLVLVNSRKLNFATLITDHSSTFNSFVLLISTLWCLNHRYY